MCAPLSTLTFQDLQIPISPPPLPPPLTHVPRLRLQPAPLGSLRALPEPQAQESPRLSRPGLRPLPKSTFSPKLGGTLPCSGGTDRKRVAPSPPSPISYPARSGARHPVAACKIVLLFCFFFFFLFCANFARAPAPGTHPPLRTAGWARRAPSSARSLCIRSAPGRSELRAPGRAARTMAGVEGGC